MRGDNLVAVLNGGKQLRVLAEFFVAHFSHLFQLFGLRLHGLDQFLHGHAAADRVRRLECDDGL